MGILSNERLEYIGFTLGDLETFPIYPAEDAKAELTGETNCLGDSQRYSYDGEGRTMTNTAYSGKQAKVDYRDTEGITITTYSDVKQSIIESDFLGNIIRATNETGTIEEQKQPLPNRS